MSKLPSVVICLSGGFDSSILAASCQRERELWPIFFDYGQPSLFEELHAAQLVSGDLGLRPIEIRQLPRIAWTGSPDVPYYPYRNLTFAVNAAAYAETRGALEVWFGFVADTDPAVFPDATSRFCLTFNDFIGTAYANKCAVRVNAPLVHRFKRELVITAIEYAFDTGKTYSCYKAGGRCGTCNACSAVIAAFADAAMSNPEHEAGIRAINPYYSLELLKSL